MGIMKGRKKETALAPWIHNSNNIDEGRIKYYNISAITHLSNGYKDIRNHIKNLNWSLTDQIKIN